MRILSSLILILYYYQVSAQTIAFQWANPDFEDEPHAGAIGVPIMKGWADCGHYGPKSTFSYSPPDVQPGFFGVEQKAHHGETYISMVARADGTCERIAQLLPKPLIADSCYKFSVWLSKAADFASYVPSGDYVDFTKPLRLRLWGSHKLGQFDELLAETDIVNVAAWMPYLIQFKASAAYKFITFESTWATTNEPYNGSLLIDDLSAVEFCY